MVQPNDEAHSDAARTLALLWRERAGSRRCPSRGRPARITVDQVVDAAIAVADAEGMGAASMSRVAERLGVAPMSLYTHVANKAELVELMVDAVFLERALVVPEDSADATDWRTRIEHYAHEAKAGYRRHPWLAQLPLVRPPLGPGLMAQQEYLLSALLDGGLPAAEAFAALGAIVAHAEAAAREDAEDIHATRTTGQSWDAWSAERQHVWEDHFDVSAYPTMARVWVEGGFAESPDAGGDPHGYGLRRLLDGIQARTRPRAGS